MKRHDQKIGERLVIGSVALSAFYPLLAHYGSAVIPPLQFAAITTLLSGLILLLILLLRRQFSVRLGSQWKNVLMVCVFVAIVPYALIFYGSSRTSGINTALLLQVELIFSFFIYHVVFREPVTRRQLGGALLMLVGTVVILYRGRLALNSGDLCIIAATALFPIGNMYAKRALEHLPAMLIQAYRGLIGGAVLFLLALFVESSPLATLPPKAYLYIFLQAVVINAFSKVIWYEGLRRLPVARAIYIGSVSPVFSVLFAVILFRELPTAQQMLGLCITLGGLWVLMKKPDLSLAPPELV